MYNFRLSILGVTNLFVTLAANVAFYVAGLKGSPTNFTSNIKRI